MEYSIGDVTEGYINQMKEELTGGLPAKVIGYDHLRQMVDVKPLIKQLYDDGEAVELPTIEDVPVLFPSGGGAILSFPINVGDNVYLTFGKLSLDEYKTSDGAQLVQPASMRLHDLNDCVAHVGMSTVNNLLERTEGAVELSFMGSKVTLLPTGEISCTDSSGASMSMSQTGIVMQKGSSTLSVLPSSISLESPQVLINGVNQPTHTHGGVTSGTASTLPPNP